MWSRRRLTESPPASAAGKGRAHGRRAQAGHAALVGTGCRPGRCTDSTGAGDRLWPWAGSGSLHPPHSRAACLSLATRTQLPNPRPNRGRGCQGRSSQGALDPAAQCPRDPAGHIAGTHRVRPLLLAPQLLQCLRHLSLQEKTGSRVRGTSLLLPPQPDRGRGSRGWHLGEGRGGSRGTAGAPVLAGPTSNLLPDSPSGGS